MPVISFEVGDVRMNLRHFTPSPARWDISFDLKPISRLHGGLTLSSDEKLEDLELVLSVVEPDFTYGGDEPESEQGYFRYHPGHSDPIFPTPPGCYAIIKVSPQDQDRMRALILGGIALRSINLTVRGEGVRYGWAPDGSEVEWDNAEHPLLLLDGYNLFWGKPEPMVEQYVEPAPTGKALASHVADRMTGEFSALRAELKLGLIAICALLLAVIVF